MDEQAKHGSFHRDTTSIIQQFVVEHIPGQHNVADFFTKSLPKSKYDQFRRYLVVNRDCMEEKCPKKKPKSITMDKTL